MPKRAELSILSHDDYFFQLSLSPAVSNKILLGVPAMTLELSLKRPSPHIKATQSLAPPFLLLPRSVQTDFQIGFRDWKVDQDSKNKGGENGNDVDWGGSEGTIHDSTIISYFICSKKLNIQMDNGQTIYKNSMLTHIYVAANPESQITVSVAIGLT